MPGFLAERLWREEFRGRVVTVTDAEDEDEAGEPILQVKILRRVIWKGGAVK